MTVVDLFAGPGGWDVAATSLGLEVVGLEWDAQTCETRRAARLSTLEVDVAAMEPRDFLPVVGLIASPPCPTFSSAGSGKGRLLLPELVAALDHVAKGADPRGEFEDEISRLVLEPLRWALALRPEWIALEQVPPALEIWKATARHLERAGYSVWTGELQAEEYGVPQTRSRAVLMARSTGIAHPPAPTHRRYVKGEPRGGSDDLFGGSLLPWVSMAEALGWGMTDRPYPTVACSSPTGGPDMEKVGGSAARAVIYDEQAAGRWIVNTGRDWKKGGSREDAQRFDPEAQPAPTIDGKGRWHLVPAWVGDRPATTVQGDPRIWPPGHKINDADVKAGRTGLDRAGKQAVRVSEQQAAVLQSFPADYPWRGNRSSIFRQIGNAVPPLMARAVLAELTS
jgi:DNA (cytosine-5)-methyltransferase 1